MLICIYEIIINNKHLLGDVENYFHTYIDHKWESKVLEMSSHKLIPPAIIDLAKYTSTRSNATYHIPGHIYILVISSILEPKTRLVL